MDNEMHCVDSSGQPWWRVRTQLVVMLAVLVMICATLWADTPVRKWMVHQVVRAEIPEIQFFAHSNQR